MFVLFGVFCVVFLSLLVSVCLPVFLCVCLLCFSCSFVVFGFGFVLCFRLRLCLR
jgi:hypothetical protein